MDYLLFNKDIINIILNFINYEINLSKLKKYDNIDFYTKNFIFRKLIIDTEIKFNNNNKILYKIFEIFIELEFIIIPINFIEILSYCKNLTHLTFGFNFNQQLNNSLNELKNLTHLTFSYYFNQELKDSLKELTNLTHLTFGLPCSYIKTVYFFINI